MGRVVRSLKHGFNIFKAPQFEPGYNSGPMSMSMPNRQFGHFYSDRSIIGSIYTRLAVDFSSVEFFHARLDENDVAVDVIKDSLNECLTLRANVDQNAQAFKQDIAFTMFENGHAVLVPTDTDVAIGDGTTFDIKSLRVGYVTGWYPRRVTCMVYDDREVDDDGKPVNGGIAKQITLPKSSVAIVENPFYNVMNQPSSSLQRLKKKLALLDGIDEAAGSGKLDMILQLPYTVRGSSRQEQAEKRRGDLRKQLKDDELGIGYIDVSEKVIQLNRPIENKLLEQIKTLQDAVYAELGLTAEIMNGSANRDTINNYFDRTIEPIANSVALELKGKFLTKTARTQNQSIEIFRDPLKLIPTSDLAEIVDKMRRSSVATANDIRPKIGMRPSKDPTANELHNPNMPKGDPMANTVQPPPEVNNGQGSSGDAQPPA